MTREFGLRDEVIEAPISGKPMADPAGHRRAVHTIIVELGGLKSLAKVLEAEQRGLLKGLELRPDAQDLSGLQIGPYRVMGYAGCAGSSTPWWRARCRSCGSDTFVRANALRDNGRRLTCARCRWTGTGPKPVIV